MTEQDKIRIEKEAEIHASYEPYEPQVKESYIAGATAENERITEQLKQERNKAIDDCIATITTTNDKLLSDRANRLEALKIK